MEKWQNFFLQRMGTDENGSTYPVCESTKTWGIYCKAIPFKVYEKAKEPAKRSYPDEHGDDEYIGPDGLYLEAYTMKVELGCKKMSAGNAAGTTAVDDVRQKVGIFLKYLRESGMLNLYSSYTRIGRQNVRLDSVSDGAKWKSEDDNEFLIFEITLKVNDPVTDIELQ
ncbi:MAG: hypothetical protein IJV38_08140 [Prevotella sp.]|nr:hypothetical protein [Prevotella sp.]